MKKLLNNYLWFFLISVICSIVLKISYNDYIDMKYLFPIRPIHIMISMIFNYIYLNIIYDCMKYFLEIDTFVLIRIKREAYYIMLLKKIIFYTISFLALLAITDFILYGVIYYPGLMITFIIEVIVGFFMIVMNKRLNNYLFVVSYLLCMCLRVFILLL